MVQAIFPDTSGSMSHNDMDAVSVLNELLRCEKSPYTECDKKYEYVWCVGGTDFVDMDKLKYL